MTLFYILNTILLIIAICAISLQFFIVHRQKEMNELNSFVLTFNKLITNRKCFIREPDCSLRDASIHTVITNDGTALMIDLIKKENKE